MATKQGHPIDRHVGNRLRMRRKMQGMSQEKLGEAVGITFQQIQKEERGVNRIAASRLLEFARILKVPVSFFFEGAPGGDTFLATAGGLAIARVLAHVTARQASVLLAVAQEFAEQQIATQSMKTAAR